jgi:hypothetical protein
VQAKQQLAGVESGHKHRARRQPLRAFLFQEPPMTDEDEIPEVEQAEPPEEPLFGPDGALDCIDGRYALIEFWLAKLGIDDPTGSAVTFGENCSLAILHPVTGKWMTPEQIAKTAGQASPVTRIQ